MSRLDEMAHEAGVAANKPEINEKFDVADYLIISGISRAVFTGVYVRVNNFGTLQVINNDGELIGLVTAPYAVYKVKEVGAVDYVKPN
jgi:hypothetical protein